MNSLYNIYTIAIFTVKDILKSKVLYGVIGMGIIVAIFSYISSELTFGVPRRIALDMGVGGMGITSIVIALFFGATLLSSEVDNRTIYTTLSRPVSRSEFILAKLFGLITVLGINILILSFFTLSVYFLLGGGSAPLIYWTIFYTFLEASLLMIVVVLFSLLMNVTLSVISGITIYAVGYILSGTLVNYFAKSSTFFSSVIKLATYIIPDFARLNVKEHLLYEQTLSGNFLIGSVLYAFIYMIIITGLILVIFNKKELS
jgi:ABC-type transport system involved in multi-copper enzyme maturation permease subunit